MYNRRLYHIALLLDILPKEYTMHTAQKIEDFSDAWKSLYNLKVWENSFWKIKKPKYQ